SVLVGAVLSVFWVGGGVVVGATVGAGAVVGAAVGIGVAVVVGTVVLGGAVAVGATVVVGGTVVPVDGVGLGMLVSSLFSFWGSGYIFSSDCMNVFQMFAGKVLLDTGPPWYSVRIGSNLSG